MEVLIRLAIERRVPPDALMKCRLLLLLLLSRLLRRLGVERRIEVRGEVGELLVQL